MRRALLAAVSLGLLAGCGSGGDDGSTTKESPSASSMPSESPSKDAADDVCTSLRTGGAGPADAFFVLQLTPPETLRKSARAQRALMGEVSPPAEVAAAWKAWRGFLDRAAGGTDPQALSQPQNRLEKQRKSLEDWAFDHCA